VGLEEHCVKRTRREKKKVNGWEKNYLGVNNEKKKKVKKFPRPVDKT